MDSQPSKLDGGITGKGFRKGHGGRPPGIPNKATVSAKTAIMLAAEKMGGHQRLYDWAMESSDNERIFWSVIFPKLVPTESTVQGHISVSWPLPKSALDAVRTA